MSDDSTEYPQGGLVGETLAPGDFAKRDSASGLWHVDRADRPYRKAAEVMDRVPGDDPVWLSRGGRLWGSREAAEADGGETPSPASKDAPTAQLVAQLRGRAAVSVTTQEEEFYRAVADRLVDMKVRCEFLLGRWEECLCAYLSTGHGYGHEAARVRAAKRIDSALREFDRKRGRNHATPPPA